MTCRSGCPTQDHDSYAHCLRSSGLRVAYCDSVNRRDFTRQKRWDAELASYRTAVKSGIQPAGTDRRSIDRANRISDATGVAFQNS